MHNHSLRVLATAEPFAFGPASKMCQILRALPKGYEVKVLARDTALEFALRDGWSVCRYSLNSSASSAIKLIQSHDIVLNVMNYELNEVLKDAGTKVVVVDSLFWMWDVPVWKDTPDYWIWCCQNFPGTLESIQACPPNIQDRIRLVGPLIQQPLVSKKTDHLLIHFGGVGCDFLSLESVDQFPIKLLKLLISTLQETWAGSLRVAGNNVIHELTGGEVLGVEIECLKHHEFLSVLGESRGFLTTAGITSVYEAFAHTIPVCFLPSLNHSHASQHHLWVTHGVVDHAVEWPGLDINLLQNSGHGPHQRMVYIKDIASQDVTSKSFKFDLTEKLLQFLVALENPHILIKKQSHFFEQLGANGIEECCREILNVTT